MRRNSGSRIAAGAFTAALAIALACGDSDDRPAPSPESSTTPAKPAPPAPPAAKPAQPEASPEKLAKRGRSIYMSNCAACHNQDATLAGAVGPEIAGSSRELIEAKVMRNEYPPGHIPLRDSRAMIPLPYLEKELPALHAFLAAAAAE